MSTVLRRAEYVEGAVLPDVVFDDWTDETGTLIDFSSGYTFSLQVAKKTAPGTILFSKSSGFTGAATSPNLRVAWATSAEITTLTPGVHLVEVTATRTADSKPRKALFELLIVGQVG